MSQGIFKVDIPASKSMMNRSLLIQSFSPNLKIIGDSQCDDVRHMKMAVVSMIRKKDIDCGEAGTVLRFMGLRSSREKGSFKLIGKPGLMRRPHQELQYILDQLSVNCQVNPDHILISSQGWKKPLVPLRIHRETSSQFATGLLLSAWNLEFDLEFEMKSGVSEAYWEMTVKMAQLMGMEIIRRGDFWKIPAHQQVTGTEIDNEPDYSSAFAIAVAGALTQGAMITNATETSLQPDFKFIQIMQKMGIKIEHKANVIHIHKPDQIKPIDINLDSTPDLFPCLAVLCAFAKGESVLRGASHLVFKESNRLDKTAELLQKARIHCSIKDKAFHIVGDGLTPKTADFEFDPDHDHRMAFAAGLLKLKGFGIKLTNPQVVSKSFPEFWQVLGFQP